MAPFLSDNWLLSESRIVADDTNFADFGNGKTTQMATNNLWCFAYKKYAEIRKTAAGAVLCSHWSLRQLDYNADPADEDVGKRTHKSPIDLELFLDF